MIITAHNVTTVLKDDKHEALTFGPTVDIDHVKAFNEENSFAFLSRVFGTEKHDTIEGITNRGGNIEGFLIRRHGHPVSAVFKVPSPQVAKVA